MSVWNFFHNKKKKKPIPARPRIPAYGRQHDDDDKQISGRLEETIAAMKNLFGENSGFVFRRFHVFGQVPAVLMFVTGMNEQKVVNRDILRPLMYLPSHVKEWALDGEQLKDVILNEALYSSQVQLESRFSRVVDSLLFGKTVVVVEGWNEALVVGSRSVKQRSVDEPETEQAIRGPREGFVELLGTNLSLLRYRLPTPDFRVQTRRIGRLTRSTVAICYMEGIVNPALVDEVNRRLDGIDIDGILDAGYLEQFLTDNSSSPFPLIQHTERPDKVVANLLEGRVAVLVDGSPFALLMPAVFSQFYQTVEDYSERFLLSSFIRLFRVIALVFSLIFPSLYVSVISFNPELIPTEFAVAVAGGRAAVPFPAVVEVFIMEISMEVLREATVRLPQQVGGALSIVGVLVVGQAAVSAGFASPITVVVIALTTIGSFATPAYNMALALRLLRFPMMILAGIFGLYGVMVGLILIVNHMLSLRSFGIPYFSPVVPGNWQGLKDTVIRFPLWAMPRRPEMLHPVDSERSGKPGTEPPRNTLDPTTVGNQWGDESDEATSRGHRNRGSSDLD